MAVELLLGFDVREMWNTYEMSWSNERRNRFLLRQDIDKPLSTDTFVWPSVFRLDKVLEPPSEYGLAAGVWADLDEVLRQLDVDWYNQIRDSWLVAITRLTSAQLKHALQANIKPANLDKRWDLLGYDVSTATLLGGLSSFAFQLDELTSMRENWSNHLNRYHLFSEIQVATEFKKLREKQVRSHGPFRVYGIYLIQKFGKID